MPIIKRQVVVPANTILENAVAGSQYEFARRNCIISGGVLANAAGILVNVNSGGDVVAEQFPAGIGTTYPVIPDTMDFNDVMQAGDRLSIPLQNTTGAAITAFVLIQIQDI